jgi:hypothetical protein
MSGQQQRDNSGVLFKNDKKGVENRPDYTGKATINGQELQISAWIKAGQNGSFMSLSFSEPRQRAESAPGANRERPRVDPKDMPF